MAPASPARSAQWKASDRALAAVSAPACELETGAVFLDGRTPLPARACDTAVSGKLEVTFSGFHGVRPRFSDLLHTKYELAHVGEVAFDSVDVLVYLLQPPGVHSRPDLRVI
jgi:hypothetical protein